MADSTRLVIELQTILRGLDKTLRGLDQVKKKLGDITQPARGGSSGTASIQRQLQQQQRAVEALQRQRSAALIAEDNRRARAAEALQRQRSASLITAQKQRDAFEDRAARARLTAQRQAAREAQRLERGNVRASESLQRQRSAAIIKNLKDQQREQERARKSILTLDQSLGRVGGSLRNLGLGLTSLGSALSLAFTAPLTALGVIATQNAVTLDSLKRGLIAITGSAAEASVQLKRLTEIAKLPGIGFQEAIQGSIRLQAVGFSAEVAERALIQFSNAVALTGGGRDELSRITVQLGQLSAKGKVLSQDLKPIIEAGPAVGRALKEAFGTVNAEDIQALGLSSEQFLDKLISQLETLPRAAGGARNTLENFADSLFRATASIGDAILPVLTKLINFFEPIITALANGFKSLPPIIQVLIISFGGLAAAAGPTLFILGQFATGIGGLISAFGRLHALGLLPTIKGFQLLTQVMRGTVSLAAGQAATAAAAAAGWIALTGAIAGVVVVLGLVVAAIAAYSTEQEKAVEIDLVIAKDRQKRIANLRDEIQFLQSLQQQTETTADQQQRLLATYQGLDRASRGRVELIEDETEKLEFLIEAKRKQLQIDEFSARATSTQVIRNLTLALEEETKAQADLTQAKRDFANAELNAATASNTFGARTDLANEILTRQEAASLKAAKALEDIGKAGEKVDAAVQVVDDLGVVAGRTTETILQQARAAGVNANAIDKAREALRRHTEEERASKPVIDSVTNALLDQAGAYIALGKAADKEKQAEEDVVKGMISHFSRVSRTRAEFDALVNDALKKFPQLKQAVDNLRKEGTFADAFDKLLGKSRKDRSTGTALRNAQEQLAKATEGVAEASAERQRSIERDKNEDLLQENENNFRLQLTAYEQYLRIRELFTRQNIQLEIREQEALHTRALAEQERFLARSRKAGVPPAERTRAIADAVEAEQKAIEAETRIRTLRAEQRRVTIDTNQAIAETAQQQIKDIRQLDIEFAELRGSIEAALNAQTVERFRERLLALGKDQENIRGQLEIARALGPEETERLQRALKRNQSEIDLIELIKEQEFATNKLTEVNEFIRRAKEEQVELERALAFEVEFRGLKEEDAIKKRLEGERRLADSLAFERDLIQATIDRLESAKFPVPQSLLDFVRDLNAEIRGLGELPFTEQFRLVEKEFDRLNDQRLLKIAEVERAVRQRDIAEAEGLLLIRRINGQYSADLEQQVELLKQIAAASNDASLQRQAQAAEETVKDANEELVGLGRQLRSTSIDALQTGITDFLASVGDNARTAKEKLLDLVNSVVARINQVIAENLSKKFIESIFGDGTEDGGGLIVNLRRALGIGRGEGQVGGVGDVAAAGVTKTVDATAAATALTTGATTAAAALTTGGATAGATLITSMTAAAASFTASIIAAGAAFAATVAASGAAQGLGGLGEAAAAATGLFPSVPGGLVRIVEGGYPEAVLTTDPKHAARQVAILKAFLKETRGLGGRIRGLAAGGFTDRIDIAVPQVSVSSAGLGELAVAGTPSTMRLRQVLVDQRDLGNWVNSSEGEQVLIDFLYRKSSVVRKIGGGK